MRTAATFKQADYERVVRAARACNLKILESNICKDGTITLKHEVMGAAEHHDMNEVDRWFKENAR